MNEIAHNILYYRYCFGLTLLEFNPDEVGVEGEGYIWRPEADSDDEIEQTQDLWGTGT